MSEPEREREVDENRKRLTRSDLDAMAKRRAKERIASIRASLKKERQS